MTRNPKGENDIFMRYSRERPSHINILTYMFHSVISIGIR